jgi:DNA-binding MarR family transcriptional regulator
MLKYATKRTYTSHHLTESMLSALSAIIHNRPPKWSVSVDALEARGLVTKTPHQGLASPTTAGYQALEDARREGW